MKKRFVALLTASLVALSTITVSADFHPSAIIKDTPIGIEAIIHFPGSVPPPKPIDITNMDVNTLTDDPINIFDDPSEWIQVTSVEACIKAQEAMSADADYYDVTSDNLNVLTNKLIIKEYDTIKACGSTEKFGEYLDDSFLPSGRAWKDYSIVSLFDVSGSAGAIEYFGENGVVKITLEYEQIKKGDELIFLHMHNDDQAAQISVLDALGDEPASVTDFAKMFDTEEVTYEIVEDGKVVIDVTGFSPFVIMKRGKVTPDTGVFANPLIPVAGVCVVGAIVVVAIVATKRRKNELA